MLWRMNKKYCDEMIDIYGDKFFSETYTSGNHEYVMYGYCKGAGMDEFNLFPLAREFRGVCFSRHTGDTEWTRHLSMEKIHILSESEELTTRVLKPAILLSVQKKYDGSMVRFVKQGNEVLAKTKLGFDNLQVVAANDWYAKDKTFRRLVDNTLQSNLAAFFEYLSPKNRVVIRYDKEQFILIQIRDEHSGEYLTNGEMCEIATYNGYPDELVSKNIFTHKFVPHRFRDWYSYNVRADLQDKMTDQEGYVVRLELDGEEVWVKVKSMWYIKRHKFLHSMCSADHIVKVALADRVAFDDGLKELANEDLSAYMRKVDNRLSEIKRSMSDRLECWLTTMPIFPSVERSDKSAFGIYRKAIAEKYQKEKIFFLLMQLFSRKFESDQDRLDAIDKVINRHILWHCRHDNLTQRFLFEEEVV